MKVSKPMAKLKKNSTARADIMSRLSEKLQSVGVIQPFTQSAVAKARTWLASDYLNLNWALGHGTPFGCLWELTGQDSSGKALPVQTPVLTPKGWQPIGELRVGDVVCCPDGGIQYVTGVYFQGVRPVYKMSFNDGTHTFCDMGHLWKVAKTRKAGKEPSWKVLTTQEIVDAGLYECIEASERRGVAPNFRWSIPTVDKLSFGGQEALPVPPYLLGVLIGDGCLVGNIVTFSNPDCDREIAERIMSMIPDGYYLKHDTATTCPRWIITLRPGSGRGGYIRRIKSLGLNVYSGQKFIPQQYLFSSHEDRKELLAGLMDTDGSATKAGGARFSTSSMQLAYDVQALVQSLGGLAKVKYTPERPDGKCAMWTVRVRTPFNPFHLTRKAARYNVSSRGMTRYISGIERVEDAETVCIRVSGPDETYVINDYIVTHNSTLAYSLGGSLQRTHGVVVIPFTTEQLDDAMFARTGLSSDPSLLQCPSEQACSSIVNITNAMAEILQGFAEINDEGSYDADGPIPVLLIWDSIAASATQELEKAMENKRSGVTVGIAAEQMGATAGQLTVALKNLMPLLPKANTLALFLNQMRVTINEGGNQWGGPQEHSGGGRALKHAASIRGHMKFENMYKSSYNANKKEITRGNQMIGTMMSLEMKKNKLAAPFKKIGFVNMFQTGIDLYLSTILHAVHELQEAEIFPPVYKGRIEYKGKKLYLADLANIFREDPKEWVELKEKVTQAQKDIDANITPDDYETLQRRAAEEERRETGQPVFGDTEEGEDQ